jgi:anti-anti-sigma factor
MPDVEYVVHPEGEMDIASVPALREEWLRAIGEQQPRLFVVDLGAVTYLDSTALGAIVSVRDRQRVHGGEVRITNANPRLAKLFRLTGRGAVIEINPQDGQTGNI